MSLVNAIKHKVGRIHLWKEDNYCCFCCFILASLLYKINLIKRYVSTLFPIPFLDYLFYVLSYKMCTVQCNHRHCFRSLFSLTTIISFFPISSWIILVLTYYSEITLLGSQEMIYLFLSIPGSCNLFPLFCFLSLSETALYLFLMKWQRIPHPVFSKSHLKDACLSWNPNQSSFPFLAYIPIHQGIQKPQR